MTLLICPTHFATSPSFAQFGGAQAIALEANAYQEVTLSKQHGFNCRREKIAVSVYSMEWTRQSTTVFVELMLWYPMIHAYENKNFMRN